MLSRVDEGIGRNVLGPGVVPKLSESPGGVRSAGPARLGQHNAEVYGELLGLSPEEIVGLSEEGVL